jgi:hypothetical protein
MPPHVSPSEIGGTTLASSYQKVRALQQREWSAAERISKAYRELTQTYRQELEDAFYRYFVYPADQAPHWDRLATAQSDVAETLTTAFEDTLSELHEETEQTSDAEMEEAFLQGWYAGLWDVYQAGHDVDEVPLPSGAFIAAAMGASAIGGLSLMDRARQWLGEARLKQRTGLRAAMVGEFTLPQTVEWFNGIGAFLEQRISGLLTSEVHQAFDVGQRMAVQMFPDLVIGEVWITRQDLAVCPVCRELHMTITPLKPIVDSHPACRCLKVPLLDGSGQRPVDFEYFVQHLT